jgi:hypothetical protein
MECDLFRLFIQRYHDGELDQAERAEYENHRRQCEACRELDGRFALLVAALNDAPLFEPSPGFNARVMSQVDVAAYRVSPVRRLLGALGRLWGAMPIPVRNGAVIAFIGALFIAVYKPFLDYMISTIGEGAVALWSGMAIVRELVDKVEVVWKGIGTVRNYEVVGQTVLRASRHAAAGLNSVQTAVAIATLVLVVIVLYRTLGAARNKGETNVSIL